MKTETIPCQVCGGSLVVAKWADGICPHCGTAYEWNEGYVPLLTEEQKAALRALPTPRRMITK